MTNRNRTFPILYIIFDKGVSFALKLVPSSPCPNGGIGRRAGFRSLWPQGRVSSSLILGTMLHHNELYVAWPHGIVGPSQCPA